MSMIDTTDHKPAHPLVAFKGQLEARADAFKAALPAHIPAERFSRVLMTAVQNNQKLLDCDRRSLWNAAMTCAQDGLLPDGREAAFVIFLKNEKDISGKWIKIPTAQYMPMIAGIRKKVRNSDEISSWEVQVVFAKDAFEFELGDDPFIKHKPYMGGDPGPVIAAYSVAVFKTGEKSREVMTRAQLDKVRASSKSKDDGPWVAWYEEMCRKTVARRHSKVLPMSTDLDDLIRRDDDLYDLAGAGDKVKAMPPRSIADRLDALAAPNAAPAHSPNQEPMDDAMPPHDAETGEVFDGALETAGENVIDHQAANDDFPGDVVTTLDEARTMAMQGRRVFDAWFNKLTPEHRDEIKADMPGLLKAAAGAS